MNISLSNIEINMMVCRKIIIILLFDNKNKIYLFDLNTLSSLLVDNAGGDEFSLNFFVAFNASESSFVISSFLINLFLFFEFSLDLILLLIYDCDIGF